MLRVVFLTNPDNEIDPSLSQYQILAQQQLIGFKERILPFLKKNYAYQIITLHKDRDTELNDFAKMPHRMQTICITSGSDGLVAMNSMSRVIKDVFERKKWLFIWVGHDYVDTLANASCKVDIVILPYWKKGLFEEKLISKKTSYQSIFEDIGIYSDIRRDFSCFIPDDKHLPRKNIKDDSKIIGIIIGGQFKGKELPLNLIEHWLKNICDNALNGKEQPLVCEDLYFIIMDSPITLTLKDKGKSMINAIIKILNTYGIKFHFESCLDTLQQDGATTFINDDPLKKIPMVLNWIETRSGDIFVTCDNIGDIYNFLGCTQSYQEPVLNVLLPENPSESDLTDKDFFESYKSYVQDINLSEQPWITLCYNMCSNGPYSSDELFSKIDKHLKMSLINEEIPKQSFMARICNSISSISLFNRKKPSYASVELSETLHGQSNEQVSNPLNPVFTIE